MALWGGRFEGQPDALFREINDSLGFDHRLALHDIKGSIAWARAIARVGVLSAPECDAIVNALVELEAMVEMAMAMALTYLEISYSILDPNICVVSMDANKTVTATFNLSVCTLTINNLNPSFGTITSSPTGIDCGLDCSETYDCAAPPSVILNHSEASGYTFSGWTGDADCIDGIVTVDTLENCIANFNIASPDFSLNNSGSIYATLVKGQAGVSTETTITVTSLYGFSSNVVLSVQSVSPSLPSGSTFSFIPSILTSAHYSSGSKFKVNISSGLTGSQTYTIVVQGVGGSSTNTTIVSLNVAIKQPGWIEF